MQNVMAALALLGCKMSYFDAYLAIGIVCMFWFVFRDIRDGSDLSEHPFFATIFTLGVIFIYPIWLLYLLAMWDRKNLKDKE